MSNVYLSGEAPPDSPLVRFVTTRFVLLLLSPWIMLGGGLTLVGLMAFDPARKDLGDVWICLPAGLALLSIVTFVIYLIFFRYPRLTLSRFEFDGTQLTFDAPAFGTSQQFVAELQTITEQRGRRGRGVQGWWLAFQNGDCIYLSRGVSHADELFEQLKPRAKFVAE